MGGLLLAIAVGFLAHSFVRFVTEGLGTPAPVAPTKHLVIGGVYRFIRNPMYAAVVGAAYSGAGFDEHLQAEARSGRVRLVSIDAMYE